jgi:hypothetical protein
VILPTGSVGAWHDAAAAPQPVLEGSFDLRLRTISNWRFTNPTVGSTRAPRTWVFDRRCSNGACRVTAARNQHGLIGLPVRRSGNSYVVTWRTRGPCRDGGTRPYSERVSFIVNRTAIADGRAYAASIRGRLIGRSPARCGSRDSRAVDTLNGTRTDLPDASGEATG